MRTVKTKSVTNSELSAVKNYLASIGRDEVMSIEEEVSIIEHIRKGDQSSKDKLTSVYKDFVEVIAKEYQNKGLDLSELITEGVEGLLKAAEKFDETRGFRFIDYAVWWVRQSILQALTHLKQG
ncbi:MAG: sigma-70 family RNA polymerase sigma factor [Bacteroidales bacterium]|nr:sigma-70 family RNA polymerase sigma factor [Bacteroidales bacterium]